MSELYKLKKNYITVFIIFTSIVTFFLGWNIYNEIQHSKNNALEHARNSFVKDLMFRKWISSHGGVYVFPTKHTPPNPYLEHIKDRDLLTTTGQKLTLMNPAYALRQLMNDYEGMYGAKGHITSLILLNPKNQANEWETKALKLFDNGKQIEFYEFLEKDDVDYIYYMQALITKESCLKCHAHQGYKVGNIRGGVSVTIPMKKYNNDMFNAVIKIIIVYFLFYIISLLGLLYSYKNAKTSLKQKRKLFLQNQRKEQMLYQQSKMASMGEMIGNIAHQWRQPIAIISMWSNNIIADIDMDEIDDKNLRKYANNINEQTKHLSQTIDDFRNFFSPDKNKTTFMVKDIIDKTMSLLFASFKTHNIEVIDDIEVIEITLFENELMQVILNVIKNAKDILVTLPNNERKLIFINAYKKNEILIIEIKDNGGGVPKNIMHKIFDPYFTTKHKSQGTGIGLYMTESIVTKHLNGKVSVENVEYEYEQKSYSGALFSINLPIEQKG